MWWCRESNGGAGFLSKIQIRDDLQETGKKKTQAQDSIQFIKTCYALINGFPICHVTNNLIGTMTSYKRNLEQSNSRIIMKEILKECTIMHYCTRCPKDCNTMTYCKRMIKKTDFRIYAFESETY